MTLEVHRTSMKLLEVAEQRDRVTTRLSPAESARPRHPTRSSHGWARAEAIGPGGDERDGVGRGARTLRPVSTDESR